MEQPQQTEPEPWVGDNCYWHPSVSTGLSCSRCEKPICPQCMVQAPVGIRCKECGKPAAMPTYDVGAGYYARAVGVAAVVAIGGGILWAVLNTFLWAIPFLPSLVGVGIGYVAGDLISRSVNRKLSKGLAWVAGGSVVAAFLVSWLANPFNFSIWGLLFIVFGVFLAVQRVRP